ncbi:MAG TPA: DNA packaging protein [Alteromonas macleodii]|nr:DNA packaging protein [Alteromonas macleodii]HAG30961.1 DNA packaging protein [Alteromonas macleodii]HAM18061.1 DNA packaging protein [Alteromonas macleodii]HAX27876.1 DNA packaging protein [Alteromonas macleodii]
MIDLEKAKIIERLKRDWQYNQLNYYLPYGHAETLVNSRVWEAKHRVPESLHFLVDLAYFYNRDELWSMIDQLKSQHEVWGEWSNKPWQLDFHNAGDKYQERMLMAANRPGKTRSAGFEVAYHMTGLYPDWWNGRRFKNPVLVWSGSPTNETSRDIIQKILLGSLDDENLGTGAIPRSLLKGKPRTRQAGVSDVVDTFKVVHTSGGVSQCVMKTYEQGWRKWQGTQPDLVWLDEEPEDNEERQRRIYAEALTRLLTSRGSMMVTFTPLLGATNLVQHFQNGGDGVYLGTATWDDAPHLGVKERDRLASSYPDHEREARSKGVPMMGEGRAFATLEDNIKVKDIEIPSHWSRIKGIDFGLDHPATVADIAWDRDLDIIYVTRVWKKKNLPDITEHVEAIKSDTHWIPISWPHDGNNRQKGIGRRLKDIYMDHNLKMLSRSACYTPDKMGSQPVEPIVMEVNERCSSGRFKVFASCTQFFDEYRNYHRRDGRLIDRNDDVLKAVFYAVMMRRYAVAEGNSGYRAVAVPTPLRMSR